MCSYSIRLLVIILLVVALLQTFVCGINGGEQMQVQQRRLRQPIWINRSFAFEINFTTATTTISPAINWLLYHISDEASCCFVCSNSLFAAAEMDDRRVWKAGIKHTNRYTNQSMSIRIEQQPHVPISSSLPSNVNSLCISDPLHLPTFNPPTQSCAAKLTSPRELEGDCWVCWEKYSTSFVADS